MVKTLAVSDAEQAPAMQGVAEAVMAFFAEPH